MDSGWFNVEHRKFRGSRRKNKVPDLNLLIIFTFLPYLSAKIKKNNKS